ncbi:D-serine dehydratase [Faunimonas pinastri]|uniref:D-serine dehydratase n=1 Tax=Faunimonas pinastri TaxID=1855383 RepID=A0A1H9Q036_9HYPH|nr:alanine racemase [Faunimonas pinastri]SER53841.1 D-serine dehydratase [Faunimonas pinastri]
MTEAFETLDDRIRGVPPGIAPVALDDVGRQGWRPTDGRMSLPVLTLDRAAFDNNRDQMLGYARDEGVAIAPHAKTPMSPELAKSLVDAGAWGTTVADIRQASVMLKAGFRRLILANEIGGLNAARRLAALLAGHRDSELYLFVDSVEAAQAVIAAWGERPDLPEIRLLPEVGAGRAGARSLDHVGAIMEAIDSAASDRVLLGGVATYEGAAATADPDETGRIIAALLALTADAYGLVRETVGPSAPLIVTAGGSVHFDRVVDALKPVLALDPAATLVLRSGAVFFHDHGIYERGMAALDGRRGFRRGGEVAAASDSFRPALRIWAEVLSRPEPGIAICGMGMRDVSSDQDLPRPLRAYRDGQPAGFDLGDTRVARLNDQHAFLAVPEGSQLAVGDVVEFGISHPCTCLDRYRVIFALDETGTVSAAYPTSFG